jgi:hypothetical protein
VKIIIFHWILSFLQTSHNKSIFYETSLWTRGMWRCTCEFFVSIFLKFKRYVSKYREHMHPCSKTPLPQTCGNLLWLIGVNARAAKRTYIKISSGKENIQVYIRTLYVRTPNFMKKYIYCGLCKKDNLLCSENRFWRHFFFVYLHMPEKMSIFRKTLCANIECPDAPFIRVALELWATFPWAGHRLTRMHTPLN